ncbi:glycosyltransferase [bacterium]|nr:glycosyltransferase [bacterium]
MTIHDAKRTIPLLSIVVPVHNEEACVEEFLRRTQAVMAANSGMVAEAVGDYEIVFVDDASSDRTYELIESAHRENSRIKCVSLSRNAGHQAALLCGIRRARGDAVIMMDGDLQHPPELIPDLVARAGAGWSVVHCVRKNPQAGIPGKDIFSRLFYVLFNRVSPVKITPNASDFRIMDRRSVDALLSMPEVSPFLRGMVPYIGYRQCDLEFECPPRFAGEASYTLKKSMKLAFDGLFSFSTWPLRLPFLAGLMMLVAGGTYLAICTLLAISGKAHLVPGWLSLISLQLMLFAFQVLFTGIVGLYVGRIYHEVKRRPPYFVDRAIGEIRAGEIRK